MNRSHSDHNFVALLKSHNLDHEWIKIIINQIHDLTIVGESIQHITGFERLPAEIQSAIGQHYDYLHEQYTRGISN
jgi:hypothetical protein